MTWFSSICHLGSTSILVCHSFSSSQGCMPRWHAAITSCQGPVSDKIHLHNTLHSARNCIDQGFCTQNHVSCLEVLTDFFEIFEKIRGAGSAESAKALRPNSTGCFHKAKNGTIFSRGTTWTNAEKLGPFTLTLHLQKLRSWYTSILQCRCSSSSS